MKKLIYTNDVYTDWQIEQAKEYMLNETDNCNACNGNCNNCDKLTQYLYDYSEIWLDDEKLNLDIETSCTIVAIADLGFWDGRKSGYRLLENNVSDIFRVAEDYNEYFTDRYNVCAKCIHHDGTNYITYRELKIDREKFEEIMWKNNYRLSKSQYYKYTKSIKPYVDKVFGW